MARKFATPIDMQLLQVLNLCLHNLSSDPTPNAGNAGQVWLNTATNLVKWSTGSAVIDPLARANHSGTQTASTVSDFVSAVQALRWSSMAAPTGAVSMSGQQFSSLGTASASGQAVEYSQFQAALASIASGMDFKETRATVVAASNISITSAPATLGNYTLVSGDSMLLVGQTTASQNGLWTFNGGGAALTRRSDASTAGSIVPGTLVVVGEHGDGTGAGGVGGARADTVWMQTAVGTGAGNSITLGTDSQTWINPFNTTTYTGGNGITIVAGVVTAVAATSGGLVVTSSGIGLDTTIAARKVAATAIPIGTTSITITHGLGNSNPAVVLRQAGARIEADDTVVDANNVTIGFAVATTVATACEVYG